MINWYEGDYIGIQFNHTPDVCMRIILPSMSQDEKEDITRKPFLNKKDLKVRLIDYDKLKTYDFTIAKGYTWDGMTIPRFAWSLIGMSKENSSGLIASMIHDYLCTHKNIIDNDKSFSTNVFNALLEVSEVNKFKRFIMKNCVACFQTLFCKW